MLALMSKCKLEMPGEFADLAPETRCCRITATLANGTTVVAEHRRSRADDAADTGWEQAVDKFSALANGLMSGDSARRIVALISTLESESTLDAWMMQLRISQ